MSRRLTVLPRLLPVLGLLTLIALMAAPSSQAAGSWGELGHFADKGGELRRPEQAFGINPEDGTAWAVDSTIVNTVEVFRIQKFEQVSGAWKVVASRTFKPAAPASEPILEVEGVAFDAGLHRAYVLVDQERSTNPNKEEQAAGELYAFSTVTSGGKIEPAGETAEGVLVGQTEETLTGSPVGQTKFAPNDKEKGLSLIEPGGLAVNPANHQILITGSLNNGTPTMWAVSQKGKIEAEWSDKEALKESFFERCACLNSPVVTSTGRILTLGESEEEVYEIPSSLNSAASPKRAFWLPTSKFECETLEHEKLEPCPFVEKLTHIDPGTLSGGEMSAGPEGNVYVHIKIPDKAEGENQFGGVMVLNSSLQEVGWTGGGSSATESKACAVNETGESNGGVALVGAANERVFMFERGSAPVEGQTKVLELGEGGTNNCPKGSATTPTATAGGIPLESFPISDKIVFSSKVTQANALSTEWEFEPGVREAVDKRQQETTTVEHKFAKAGKFTVVERIHTDDLATPTIEVSKAVTILGPPSVRNEKATVEGTGATLSGEVDPNLQSVTKCEIQYGLVGVSFTAPGTTKVACPESAGEGEEFVPETVKVSGLEAGKEYHFRLFAESASGASEAKETQFIVTEVGAPEAETLAATGVGSSTATLNGKVNPKGTATTCKFEYGPTSTYGKEAPCSTSPGSGTGLVSVSAAVTGLTGTSTYHFRLVAENSGKQKAAGTDRELKTTEPADAPSVETLGAGTVTQTGATLKGTVNPHGEATECRFEYGTTTAYGKESPCPTAPGSGRAGVEESAAVTGLTPASKYHYRLVAKNPLGESKGADREVATLSKLPPTAETLGVSSVTTTAATLTGRVDPRGEATSCKFLYGPTAAYGKEVQCTSAPGTGNELVGVSGTISGLAQGTVYHYRLIAESAAGREEGADLEVRTAEVKAPPPPPPSSPPPQKQVENFKAEVPPAVSLAGTALTVARNGSFSLKLSCPVGDTQCAGAVTLKTLTAVAAGAAKAKKAVLTLSSGSFGIAGGKVKVLSLHLTSKAKALLAKLHTVRARLTVVARNPQGASRTMTAIVTLKAAKKHH